MSAPRSPDHYLDPYRHSHSRHGSAFEVTLWANPRSQRTRFEVFTEMCFLAGKRVLDAGCSRGDFAEYLIQRDVHFSRYIGIDGLPEVINFARDRSLPRCEFYAGDFVAEPNLLWVGDPEVICISGTLNTMDDAHIYALLDAAWSATRQVLLFNFLSDRCGPEAPPQDGFARRISTLRILDWAFTKTPAVSFRQDYFKAGHDATVMMRKER
jgi:SAM-dependent methyltransferase